MKQQHGYPLAIMEYHSHKYVLQGIDLYQMSLKRHNSIKQRSPNFLDAGPN